MPLIALIPLILASLSGLGKTLLIIFAIRKAQSMLTVIGLGVVIFGIGAICGALAYRKLKQSFPSIP